MYVCIASVSALCVSGCGLRDKPFIVRQMDHEVRWEAKDSQQIPGIDSAGVSVYTYIARNGRITPVVLWTSVDYVGSGNKFESRQRSGRFVEKGVLGTAKPHLQRIPYELVFSDEGASIEVGDKSFNLENGTVFLIQAKDANIEVRQLGRDMTAFPTDEEGLRQLAGSDSEIREFFEGGNSKVSGTVSGAVEPRAKSTPTRPTQLLPGRTR